MSDENEGRTVLPVCFANSFAYLALERGIKASQRFVQKQQIRPRHDRPRKRNAMPLTAAKRSWNAGRQAREPHRVQ